MGEVVGHDDDRGEHEDDGDAAREDDLWTKDQRGSLVTLIEIQPDLSEIVEGRASRLKLWRYVRTASSALVEFIKLAAMIGAAIGVIKAALQGWLK